MIESLLYEADAARARGDLSRARTLYEEAIALAPPDGGAAASLGLALSAFAAVPDIDAATRDLRRCVLLDPCAAEAWLALAYVRLIAGDAAAAADAFAAALTQRPDDLALAVRRAEAAAAAGRGESLRAELAQAWEAEPERATHAVGLAALLEGDGAMDAATDVLEAACLLHPASALLVALLGSQMARAGKLRAALPVLREARARNPGRHETLNDLATVLMRLHRPAESAAIFVELDAAYRASGDEMPVSYLCNYAVAISNLGEQEAALAIARRAAAAAPGEVQGFRAICNTLPYADAATGEALLDAAILCAQRLARPAASAPSATPRAGKIRVGLLSGSLRTHPVGWLTVAAFEALPREQFELVAFSDSDSDDFIARRFRAACVGWHATAGLNDDRLAKVIRAQEIGILFDLGGWGDFGRMAVCAHRVAPVQIKWVGMQNHSSGLVEMDFFMTDRWESPAGHEPLYSERLLRMPDGYVCYTPPADAPPVAPAPWIANGYITFGCFNTLAKLTLAVVRTWARILHTVPDARLMLKMQQLDEAPTRDAVLARFENAGVSPARLILAGSTSHRGQLEAHAGVDVMLDPFPYSGGLTTIEALWMGVPTLTLPGTTFASRHSMSHLSNAGLPDWVARDPDDYVGQAVARAAGAEALAQLRSTLRAQVAASPLTDQRRFGANLAAALTGIWDEVCAAAA